MKHTYKAYLYSIYILNKTSKTNPAIYNQKGIFNMNSQKG